jgi:SAM-dependent methyltransferase
MSQGDVPGPERRETYTHGYGAAAEPMTRRTAAQEARLLLPHLRPGLRLLDAGCGPGTTTVDLAAAVAPGEVVGIDIEPAILERARVLAAERGVPNVRFEVASAYALPFPDASFDAAFARSLLEHLADPLAAVRELRRVLRPGGVVGLRDGDWGGRVQAPASPLVEEGLALYARLWARNGGNPNRGREHRALLRAAGFSRIEASATAEAQGTPQATRDMAARLARVFGGAAFVERIVELGWADQDQLAAIADACRAWGEHPDAFLAVLVCDAVGWAD